MRRSTWVAMSVLVSSSAIARHFEFQMPGGFVPEFGRRGIGGATPAPNAPAYLAGSRIAALENGGALAIDADTGKVLRTDANGAFVDAVELGKNAGMLVYDPAAHVAYVADRANDRIAVISVGEKLALRASWPTPREPYGIALSPDRKTIYATAIADRKLVEFDPTGKQLANTTIEKEPRGIAISTDGSRAMIGHIASAAVSEIALADHRIATRALPANSHLAIPRAAFAPMYLSGSMAVVPFQRSEPQPDPRMMEESGGHYGGQFESPPMATALAFLGREAQSTALSGLQQPRALARDGSRDTLYLAGMGNDLLVRVVRASQIDLADGGSLSLARKEGRCGPDGIAIGTDGTVMVWCSFSRSIARVPLDRKGRFGKPVFGTSLVASTMNDQQHEGMELFHTASTDISEFGALACASCHLDGRADGLSWRIHGENLQTPMLGGRLADTAPFKWDGKAKDLPTSVKATIDRLGGDGLAKRHIASLVSYLETMPAIRPPSRDTTAVARGKTLFESADLGCTQCHDGAAYTDRETHKLTKQEMDTPSLRGLAASAPYFHDGSAATLESLLRERGTVHGMAEATRALTDAQVHDLVAYLESL